MKSFFCAVFFKWTHDKKSIFVAGAAIAFVCCILGAAYRSQNRAVSASGETLKKKTAYLTFDDGPSKNTSKVLDILKKENAVATFFLIGSQIDEEMEPVIKRMREEGNYVGVHTFTHKAEEIYASANSYEEDVKKTAKQIESVIGEKPAYYRFPWGSVNMYVKGFNDAVIEDLCQAGFTHVDWNVSAEDSVGCPTKESILSNIKKDCEKYDDPVILMHDSCINDVTVDTLTDIIAYLKEKGYVFGTIDQRTEPCQSRR